MGTSDVVLSIFLSYLQLLTSFQKLHMAIHRSMCIINTILMCCEKLFISITCISVDFHTLLSYQKMNQEPGLTNLLHVSLEGTGSPAAQLVKHINLMLIEYFMQATMSITRCSMNKIHLLAPRFKNIVVKIDNKGMVLSGSPYEINGGLGVMKLRALRDVKLILHKCMVIKFIKTQNNIKF